MPPPTGSGSACEYSGRGSQQARCSFWPSSCGERPSLGGNAFRYLLRSPLDRLRQVFGRMGAADREEPAEDEAWHAVDAGFLGGVRLGLDVGDILVRAEPAPNVVAIHAAIHGRLHQHITAGEVAAFAEIERHQP